MAKVLSNEDVRDRINQLKGWSFDGNAMTKTFALPAFTDVMVLVNEVAQLAEDANHHPDIDIRYNKVRFLLTSHDAGGITEKDLALAKQINETESIIERDEE